MKSSNKHQQLDLLLVLLQTELITLQLYILLKYSNLNKFSARSNNCELWEDIPLELPKDSFSEVKRKITPQLEKIISNKQIDKQYDMIHTPPPVIPSEDPIQALSKDLNNLWNKIRAKF